MDRLEADRSKLIEAVGLFRVTAKLHSNSRDDALIRYAHGAGRNRDGAEIVRLAWHDYEAGRHLARLPVTRYLIAEEPGAAPAAEPGKPPRAPRERPPADAPRRGTSSSRRRPAPPDDDEILF